MGFHRESDVKLTLQNLTNFFRFAGGFFLQERAKIIDKKMDSKRLDSLVTCLRSVQGQPAYTFNNLSNQVFTVFENFAKSNKAQGKSIKISVAGRRAVF